MRNKSLFIYLFFIVLIFCLTSCFDSNDSNKSNSGDIYNPEVNNNDSSENVNRGKLYERYLNDYDINEILNSISDDTGLDSECIINNKINSYFNLQNIKVDGYQFRYKKIGEKHAEIAIFKIADTDQNEAAFYLVADRKNKIREEDGTFVEKNFVAEQKGGILVIAYMNNASKVVNSIFKKIK